MDNYTGKRHKKLQQEQLIAEIEKLKSYLKNTDLGMTKDMYFNMCESLGTEPVEDEIPPEMGDLSIQTQEALDIFDYLPDKWNDFSGSYVGKDLSSLFIIFDLLGTCDGDKLLIYRLLSIIISERISSVGDKIKREAITRGTKGNKGTRVFN